MAEAGYETIKGKHAPRCPNHKVHLTDLDHGVGICPISGARFEYDADEYEKTKKLKLTALGQIEETGDWNVKQIDGDNG